MDKKKTVWVGKLAGVALSAPAAEADLASHARGQEVLTKRMGPETRDAIRESFAGAGLEMAGGDVMVLLDVINSDPMAEVDTFADTRDARGGLTPKQADAIRESYDLILATQAEMERLDYYKVPVPEDPEFPTPEEEAAIQEAQSRMARDLWQPLAREGIIPENLVPDAYSEVMQTFAGANEAYDARLQEHSRAMSDADRFLEKFGPVETIGKGVLKLGSSTLGFVGDIAAVTENAQVIKDVAEAKEIYELIEIGLTNTSQIVKTAVTERDTNKVVDLFNGMLGPILEKAGVPTEVATAVTKTISGAARSASVGAKLAEGKLMEALTDLGAAIADSFSATGDETLAEVGEIVKGSIGRLAAADGVRAALMADPPEPGTALNIILGQVSSEVGAAAKKIVGELATKIKLDDETAEVMGDVAGGLVEDVLSGDDEDEDEGGDDEEEESTAEAIVRQVTDLRDFAKEIRDDLGEIERGTEEEATQMLTALNAKSEEVTLEALAKEDERLQQLAQSEDRQFQFLLATGQGLAVTEAEESAAAEEMRLASLEQLVAVIQRDRKTFELARKIATKGPALLSDLLPGMGLAAACMQLAFAITEAIKHAEELLKWMKLADDARTAATVQVEAFLNRQGIEKKQLIVADIKVGIQAVKVVAEAAKLSPAAPIGLAISSGADVAEAAVDLGVTVADMAEAREAWKLYKSALAEPRNRKAARKAIRKNATLAKYAMAYGAFEAHNPMAIEALRQCGITEASLEHPDTDVSKLVNFLETLYNEDPVIVRSVAVRDDWHPGDVEVNHDSFCLFHLRATTKADPPLAPGGVNAVKAALGRADTSAAAFEAALKAVRANPDDVPAATVETQAADDLKAVCKALKSYAPLSADGTLHTGMRAYLDTLAARAMLRRREILKIAGREFAPLRESVPAT